MLRDGDRLSKFALPIAVILLSALAGLLIPLLSGNQPGGASEPWTPPTPTSTATSRPTSTPLPTAQPTEVAITSTPVPTATPTLEPVTPTQEPSPTATPATQAEVTVDGLNLRAGPGTDTSIVGNARQGDTFIVTGKSADGTWLQVCCVRDQPAWLSQPYVNLRGLLDPIPVVP